MRYTQLDFAPCSSWGKSKFEQARLLLRDLVKGRIHGFPCYCGACIYAAFKKSKKVEGRSFSKRTFFVFFLQTDFLMATAFDKRISKSRYFGSEYKLRKVDNFLQLIRRGYFSAEAHKRNLEGKTINEGYFHGTHIYFEKIRSISRRRTLSMIKKLEKEERGRERKIFLLGILKKKCFYTYYNRAFNSDLPSIVGKVRKDLLFQQRGNDLNLKRKHKIIDKRKRAFERTAKRISLVVSTWN